ncbi:flagellar biosynthetic protein FliO [Rhodanobacter sp. MP7CTX1]|jgi:flagellar protein FliO/FliZ|uniref:flagellar biosynthetic protein FliO n=1 Tax=Rhodanobacter sp. MP7CTX1 TaxID=2723084 RepID=UPI00160B83E9|nr:flagellar biosynthetic protein FliO [Rhodanobacter sp. MP7CTX1]MBB6186242.1 flagellar protein FliO/FliZ [Rhodanobacter sp. MP7CTX1]
MSAVLAILAPIAQPTLPDINVAGELLRVLLSLAGIVLLIFAAGWLGRRLQGRQFVGGRRLRCLETLPVGSRERVLLLEVEGQRVLVGVGAGGVRTLHVYECVEPVAAVEAAPPPSFSELLGRWRRR